MNDDSLSAATRARLLERARVDAVQRNLPLAAAGPRRASYGRWSSGAFGLAAAAALVFALVTRREAAKREDQAASAYARQEQRIDSLARLVDARTSFIASLTGPSVQVMSLTAGGARTARALMFWDTARNRWTFVAHDFRPLPSGRTYQLWLVTATRKISAGTFDVTPAGNATLEATYALEPSDLAAIAVTEEAAGGAPQPTGAPVIAVSAR